VKLLQLRYVKLVASNGSFSMSARICGVSQPTISNAVSDLEEELRARIFLRTTRCVELTSFGASIIGHVDAILSRIEDIRQEAEAHSRPEQKLLRVAFSPIIDSPRLMCAFDSFREGNPGTAFLYKECGGDELESRLNQGKLDVVCGIRIFDSPARRRCTLYRDVLHFLPKGGPEHYRGPRTVTLSDISKETIILPVDACGLAPAIRELFREQLLSLDEYPGHPLSYRVLQEWSSEGIGAAILPESRIAGDANAFPVVVFDNQPVTIEVEAVWTRGSQAPQVKAFVRFLKEATASGALRCCRRAATTLDADSLAVSPALS
jgi:LysR family transcriptional regulator, hydrogen peroxide-inducible genes activator